MKKTLLMLLFAACCLAAGAQGEFWIGADISSITEMEAHGAKWRNWRGQEMEPTALMQQLGMNAVRLRVWVDPSAHGGWCDKNDLLEKALRAKRLGMEVMVDFHYSDWWADPAKQNIPQAWQKMNYKKMARALAAHTREVLTLLKQNGVSPRWVQVGNETSNGLLWSVEMDPVTGWEKKDADGNTTITKSMGHWRRNPEQYAGFIRAGYEAAKEVFPATTVIVHLDNGFDNDLYNDNLDILVRGGAKWDMIGMSVYPYWAMQGGKEPSARMTIRDSMRNIRKLKKKYGTDVMIVETGFEVDPANPWKMEAGREQMAELLRRSRTETDGACKGIFYWEPECLPGGYNLGAFGSDGRPTAILRALLNDNPASEQLRQHYDRPLVEIETTKGTVLVELYNDTPVHRDNFLRLADTGALEGSLFHRVISDFMIQGGDPTTKDAPPTSADTPSDLLGNGDYPAADGQNTLPAELCFPEHFHKRGALAAAREGDADNPELRSSSSQFYIVWGFSPVNPGRNPYAPTLEYYTSEEKYPGTPWLDAGYTVFGEVVSGLETVDAIQSTPTDSHDRPIDDVRILKMKRVN